MRGRRRGFLANEGHTQSKNPSNNFTTTLVVQIIQYGRGERFGKIRTEKHLMREKDYKRHDYATV